MAFYKDINNNLHELDDPSFSFLLPVGCIMISSEEAEAIRNPPKSNAQKMAEELAALNAVLQSNLDSLASQFTKALLSDGASEATKVDNIRAQQSAIKAQYSVDYTAIRAKYQ